MRLIGKRHIEGCKELHAASRKPIDRWVRLIEEATLETTSDMKSLFGSNVDFVEGKTVFDVGGNKYRVVTMVDYPTKLVTVIFVGTHVQYDKGDWKK